MLSLPQFPQHAACTRCDLHAQVAYDRWGNSENVPRCVGMATYYWPKSLTPSPETPAIFVIGQNPGLNEDKAGEPFVGESGKLVRNVILPGPHLHELATIYLTNAARCFTVGNSEPPPAALKACAPYLVEDLAEIAKNSSRVCIVVFGAAASSSFLKYVLQTDEKSNQKSAFALNGRDLLLPSGQQVRFYATYHPAYILRQRSYLRVTIDHLQMLSEHLQGLSPVVTEPAFIPPRAPNA